MSAIAKQIAELEAENARLTDRAERYEEALQRILQWSEAYPTDIFIPPDYKAVHAILQDHGKTLDALSADCMRMATDGVGKIARQALAAARQEGGER